MKPNSSKRELEQIIQRSGSTVTALTLAEGLRHMLTFYQNVRAENCPLDADGDMLLFQWGTFDWGQGRFFQCNITRQFISANSAGDEGMSQLSLTFYYAPSAAYDALKAGNRWCNSPSALAEFEAFATGTEAFRSVAHTKPAKLSLQLGGV